MSTSTQSKSREIWWKKGGVIFIMIIASFGLGIYLGSIAFGKKSKEHDEVEQLKTDTARLNSQIIEMKQMNNDLLYRLDSLIGLSPARQ
jgi:hypothetical protein